MSRGRELLVNLSLAFGVSAGLLVICEGTARLFERPEGRPRTADEWAPGAADDHFYTLKRRPLGWPPSEINADGLRDRAHSEARPEDVWRVAVLGDSVTEGFGLAAEQAFPRELGLALPYFDGLHRFLPALVRREGFDVGYVDVIDRPRRHGVSNYGMWDRLWVGILDLGGVWWLIRRRKRVPEISEV